MIERDRPVGNISCDVARDAASQFLHHPQYGADLPRCAISTLKPLLLDEGSLQWVQSALSPEPLDCGHRPTLILNREGQTRQDTLALHQHCAGAARTLVASLLRAV